MSQPDHADHYPIARPWVIVMTLLCALLGGLVLVWIALNPRPPAVVTVAAARHPSEVEICREIAMRPNWRGGVEVRLKDDGDGRHAGQSRIDIVTDGYVWEADWAHKWTEAVGQSLYYALQWEEEHPRDPRKPGIVLLVRDPQRESHYVSRCRRVCDQHNITLVVETVR